MEKTRTRYGWHIVNADRRLRFDDGRKIRVGSSLKFKASKSCSSFIGNYPRICVQGMHASPTVNDAANSWRETNGSTFGAWLCRVRVSGTGYGYPLSKDNPQKFVGRTRTVLGMLPLRTAMRHLGASESRVLRSMRARNIRNGVTSVSVR
jgi:hypothetical protein